MNRNTLTLLIGLCLSGCSYLEHYFPDKERDYQYTTEIPLLNWPTDLQPNRANVVPVDTSKIESETESEANNKTDSAASESGSSSLATASSLASEALNAPVTLNSVDDRNTLDSLEIVRYDDGESRLRLGTGASKAWRVVSKSLSRNAIEVTERNFEQGMFVIQYDPHERKAKDSSFMDEINFILHGIANNDKEYQLKLEEHSGVTDLIVLDEDHLPLPNDAAASRLLEVLASSIKADMTPKASK